MSTLRRLSMQPSRCCQQPCSRPHVRSAAARPCKRLDAPGAFSSGGVWGVHHTLRCASVLALQAVRGRWPAVSSWGGRGRSGRPQHDAQDPSTSTDPIKATSSLAELEVLVARHAAAMNHYCVSASFSHLAQNYARWDPQQAHAAQCERILAVLSAQLGRVVPKCGARQAAGIMWASAKLQPSDMTFCSPCLGRFCLDINNAQPQHLANVVWALATLAESGQPSATAAVQAALEHKRRPLSACVQRFCSNLDAATPQAIANVVWALAKLGHVPDGQQLQQLLQALALQSAAATPQELSNALWALTELQQPGVARQQTVQRLVESFAHKLSEANSQAISNYLLALARLAGLSDQAASPLISEELACKSALAAVTALMDKGPLNGQVIGNSAWPCGVLGVYDAAFFTCLHSKAQQAVQQLAPQNLGNLAWAAAKLGYAHADQLVACLVAEAARRLSTARHASSVAGFSHQGLSNLCWAAAVADLPLATQPQLARQLKVLCEMLSQHWEQLLQGKQLQQEHRWQLAQLHIWLQDTHQLDMLPAPQLKQCQEARTHMLQQSDSASGFQDEVLSAMKQLQRSVALDLQVIDQQEVPTADGLLLMDCAAVFCGQPVAVEADGPSHFTYPHRLVTGDTQSRDRALKARGRAVVSIPGHKWIRLRSDKQRLAYLQHKLQQAVQEYQHVRQLLGPAATAGSSPGGSSSNGDSSSRSSSSSSKGSSGTDRRAQTHTNKSRGRTSYAAKPSGTTINVGTTTSATSSSNSRGNNRSISSISNNFSGTKGNGSAAGSGPVVLPAVHTTSHSAAPLQAVDSNDNSSTNNMAGSGSTSSSSSNAPRSDEGSSTNSGGKSSNGTSCKHGANGSDALQTIGTSSRDPAAARLRALERRRLKAATKGQAE